MSAAPAAMLLLIDAGNTRIKWALADAGAAPGAWLASGARPHAMPELLTADWQAALAGRAVSQVLLSNVAGPALGQVLQTLLAALPAPDVVCFASLPQLAGLRNGYRDPYQLGCDRFAAAIGGRWLVPDQPIVIATCGTATTIDAVSADGCFVGGMILPGLGLMAGALARNTAQLPHITPAAQLPHGFADNTADAILSGCLAAQAGAIERACAAHGATSCLLSGGAAPAVATALSQPYRMVDNIVLLGLHVAATSPS